MKLSIIVISYNEAQYLRDAIDSCLSQNISHELEIIIGDDGSSDGSIEIIKEYHHKYPETIKYFVVDRGNPQNVIPSLRVSNVIKRGFSLATGDYLMVMSGDDLLIDENKCQIQLDFLEQEPAYSGCYTNYQKFWDSGEKVIPKNYQLATNALFWSRYYVHITCFVFRSSVTANLTRNFCDDTALIFSILKSGKIKYLPINAFGYRQRPVSIMSSADTIELYLLEMLLMQDLLESGGYLFSTLSRYSLPLIYLFKQRETLADVKYAKYINHSCEYQTDIIGLLSNYDLLNFKERLRLHSLMAIGFVARKLFVAASFKARLANR